MASKLAFTRGAAPHSSPAHIARRVAACQALLRSPVPRGLVGHANGRSFSQTCKALDDEAIPGPPPREGSTRQTKAPEGGNIPHNAKFAAAKKSMKTAALRAAGPGGDFTNRHIGPRDSDVEEMLKQLGSGAETMDRFISQVIPEDVILPPTKPISRMTLSEPGVRQYFERLAERNPLKLYLKGDGYYPVETPAVIKRNVLENPAWYTSYTPYQAELSQGRLESLLNFQTMVADLTALPVANASLLDEGTAAAEAMTISLNHLSTSRAKRSDKTYVVSTSLTSTTKQVIEARAEGFGIRLQTIDFRRDDAFEKLRELGEDLVGVMVQYPDLAGSVSEFQELADVVHEQGALLSAATDLSALTILKPPGEWGADIALGNSQRFGVPMGYGGPHAAFMAVREPIKRRLPGRLVGVSKDRLGRRAFRLALQTREQHIRREKATSNVCTAQALLANMAAMYAIYHGPGQLRDIALNNMRHARIVQDAAKYYGIAVATTSPGPDTPVLFDTVTLSLPSRGEAIAKLVRYLRLHGIEPTIFRGRAWVRLAIHDEFSERHFLPIVQAMSTAVGDKGEDAEDVAARLWIAGHEESLSDLLESIPSSLRRRSPYLTHPVFNSYHSETEMLRYIHHLQSKDLSLTNSMIPLGSCTMKLNGSAQMQLITHPRFANVHPHVKADSVPGYEALIRELEDSLKALTGMDVATVQPNSGAQGEYAGLRAIRKYHEERGAAKRDICLIPVSAHGTNPASAAMAGMRVVSVKCDGGTGNLDLEDLGAKCEKHADELAAIMVTYPSTYGVFEPHIRRVCDMVHQQGGLVYMDGANMNAQIGLTSPGAIGADVCHLNLHKTFCIPHGGGGPGVGPICVKEFLREFLPTATGQKRVSSAYHGSAGILPISWAYIKLMRDEGLRKATNVALLNANYLLVRLREHYPILHTNEAGRCAHEFIIDARPFQKSAGVEVSDIAKRLQDYGFHAPTMSWPVPNTLMIEPTESESKEELDRFVDAMVAIREEIRDVEEGRQPREGNVLKMAPHPQVDVVLGDGDGAWDRPYSREKAVYPLPYLKEKKFWPSIARVDDTYGDTNLFCTCPPVEDTTDA